MARVLITLFFVVGFCGFCGNARAADHPVKSTINLQWQEASAVLLIRGTTNLPDGMQLDFRLSGPHGVYDTNNFATVHDGAFQTRGFFGNAGSRLPRGRYRLTVSSWGIAPQIATPGRRTYSGPDIVGARAQADGQKLLPQVWAIMLK